MGEGLEFCLLEQRAVFLIPTYWPQRTKQDWAKEGGARRFFAVDRDRPSGAIAFSFCEGSGSTVPLAVVQPGAVNTSAQPLADRGVL